MQVRQNRWIDGRWDRPLVDTAAIKPQLVLCFAARELLSQPAWFSELQASFSVPVVACSTSGEIFNTEVTDQTASLVAMHFERTEVVHATETVLSATESREAGGRLAKALARPGLRYVLLICDGLAVNGSQLAAGLSEALGPQVIVTGGLAGDAGRFQKTIARCGDIHEAGQVVAVGLSGPALQVAHASLGGWDAFGPDRLITRSKNNVLYELDGQSALSLYKSYLGEHAQTLPGSALLFPLSIKSGLGEKGRELVRTILSIDESAESMTFAGDVPEGWYAQLMRANFERLIDGAGGAAEEAKARLETPEFALLISCVGRKMVLKQRTEEELEAVRDILGEEVPLAGFYSYGEISPLVAGEPCQLHNQTMTITTFAER